MPGSPAQLGLGDDEAAWDQIIDINLRAHIRAAERRCARMAVDACQRTFRRRRLGGWPADPARVRRPTA